MAAVRRENYTPSKSAVLCSSHFLEQDLDRTSLCCVRVREGAIPKVFEAFPTHLKRKTIQRKPPAKRLKLEPSTSKVTEPAVEDSPSTSEVFTQSPAYPTSPSKATLKENLQKTKEQVLSSKKRIKTLLQAKRRLKVQKFKLLDIISDLRKNNIIESNCVDVLETVGNGVSDLLKRQIAKATDGPLPKSYSPQLRTFALTLNFYSPKAYEYVRKTFNTCLPHPRTLSKWYECVDDRPGFTGTAFSAIAAKAQSSDNDIICALMMDEMAIKKHIESDGKGNYHGFIDMGTELNDDSLPVAKEALVFMVNAVNQSWKLPVGYFLVDGLNGEQRKNLVLSCLSKLHSAGVKVVSLTHDGAASNLSMLRLLGVKFDDPYNIQSFFPHPITFSPVYIFLDACHMLKLVRNTFSDKGSMAVGNSFVLWKYINDLHKLQENEGLHLGNKLRSAHIDWKKKKMNVRLAAQTLSESVCQSLQFCLNEQLSDFAGCEATIHFINVFNRLFDVLNSRNLNAFEWKRPIQIDNCVDIIKLLNEAKSYILSLKESLNGRPIVKSNRKTGFIGFLLCIDSVCHLYSDLVESGRLKYLLTYKFSQDHLELFFGKIRSKGGCNNNPTARQFKGAYKKLLVHNDVQDVRGNCLSLEKIPILTTSSNVPFIQNHVDSDTDSVKFINDSVSKQRCIDDYDSSDHAYSSLPNESSIVDTYDSNCSLPSEYLSIVSENIVVYIAGFVVYKLKKSLTCECCMSALIEDNSPTVNTLIGLKSKGALIYPSEDVISICKICEKLFRKFVSPSGANMTLSNVQCHKLIQSVLKSFLHRQIFSQLTCHMFDTEGFNNHVVFLLKAIAEKYFQVRYNYAAKKYNASFLSTMRVQRSRQVMNRLVIFTGQ